MKVIIVEDDLVLGEVVAFTLRREGFDIALFRDGAEALTKWRAELPHLILLDIELPGADGFTICREIRKSSNVPIIMLTSRDNETDIVTGLQIGADDYIVKPFSPAQFIARVQSVIRRSSTAELPNRLNVKNIKFDPQRHQVDINGREGIQLTQLESRLLETLLLNSGNVLTVNTLIERVWGAGGADRTMLKQLIYRLRQKLETNPAEPEYIHAVPGVGYTLVQ
jgi:DNA-binding response OmpR family regulator